MGNVPPSASTRSQSLPASPVPSETSSRRDSGRKSLPTSNIMQVAKKRIQGLAQTRQSLSNFPLNLSTDVQSYQSSKSDNNSESSSFHPTSSSLLHASFSLQEGRPFHSCQNAKYSLPCDEQEQDRMMALHFLVKHKFQGNYSAPVTDLLTAKHPREERVKVLDVGCGPGHWTLEMASEFPMTDFYGVDIAAIYPNDIKPANTYFFQDDILTCTIFEKEMFDYIFVRHVYGCFSVVEWDLLMKVISRLLKPGGYVEFREIDPTVKNPGPMTDDIVNIQFTTTMRTTRNIDPSLAQNLTSILSSAGFADIHHNIIEVGNGWGECGDIAQNNLADGLSAYGIWFCHAIGLDPEEYEKRRQIIIEEGPIYRSYYHWHMAWARKPSADNVGVDVAEWEGIKEFVHGYIE